jgi:RNA polymerase sigma factor (sigma-70 family)
MTNGQMDQDLCVPGRGTCALAAEAATDRQLLERFARRQDKAAFETLVERHGPMVLAVCQRVLHHSQDAEDAFQATFLILVRKAATISKPELLGNWLYGVAYRTALKARANAARRSERERQAAAMSPPSDPPVEAAWRELRGLLDEELNRLPEKYRAPLVLCYLQGKTNEEAARQLGWPVGSMSARLARGRELLRDRLARRDRALPAGVFLGLLSQKVGGVALPAPLVSATVEAGLGWAAGQTAGISSGVQALVEGGLGMAKYKKMLPVLVLLTLILGGAGAAAAFVASGLSGPSAKKIPPPNFHQLVPKTSPSGAAGKSGGDSCKTGRCGDH